MADGSRLPEIRIKPKTRARSMLIGDLFCGAGGLSNDAKAPCGSWTFR